MWISVFNIGIMRDASIALFPSNKNKTYSHGALKYKEMSYWIGPTVKQL